MALKVLGGELSSHKDAVRRCQVDAAWSTL